MADVERACREKFMERDLFLLELETPDAFPDHLSLSSPRFVCLLAWDARGVNVDAVSRLARKLLNSGAVYICTWGPDCERVHDIIDEEELGPCVAPVTNGVVMTTWHANEPLAEAIWFTLHCSCPDEAYAQGCSSTLGLSIGSRAWGMEIRSAFSEPGRFSSGMLQQS